MTNMEIQGSFGLSNSSTPPINSLHTSSTSSDSPNAFGNGGENRNYTPLKRYHQLASGDKSKNTCFNCKEEGHWFKDCPKRSPKRSKASTSSPSPSDHGLPNLQCRCGAGICFIRVSKSVNNPGRKYYCCPLCPATKCNFFQWCDEVKRDEIVETPPCDCGAGLCRISHEISGPGAGGKFFVCPIKKGQGACKYRKPLDATKDASDFSSPRSTLTSFHNSSRGQVSVDATLTNCHDTSPSNSDVVEEGDFSYQGMKPPVVDTAEHSQNLGIISKLPRKGKLPQVDFPGEEDMSDIPLQRHCKCRRLGALRVDGFTSGSVGDCWHLSRSMAGDPTIEQAPQASALALQARVHQRQAEFLRQMSSAEGPSPGASCTPFLCDMSSMHSSRVTQNYLERDAIYQMLGFKGWCGRLLFSPSRCLTVAAPKPFFCCVFPSFDPIYAPRDIEASTIVIHNPTSTEANMPSLLTSCQPSSSILELSAPSAPFTVSQGNTLKSSIPEAFKQAALVLQNDLLSRFHSMDFHEHESMIQDANSVFDILGRLLVDFQPFKEQVEEFISYAVSLAKVETSIKDDCSSQELVDRFNCQKQQLQDIYRLHSETLDALRNSDERLESVRKEAARLKEMLLHLEEELCLCEAENVGIRTRFDQISQVKSETELIVQVASKKAEEALKLCQQREAECNAARAAFETARSNLTNPVTSQLLV